MKEDCKHLGFHGGGSFSSVAEGGDDPYSYYFCHKMNWSDGDEPQDGEVSICDKCKFYERENK